MNIDGNADELRGSLLLSLLLNNALTCLFLYTQAWMEDSKQSPLLNYTTKW